MPRVYKYASEVNAIERCNGRRQDQDEKAAAALELGPTTAACRQSHVTGEAPKSAPFLSFFACSLQHIGFDFKVVKEKTLMAILDHSAHRSHQDLLQQESQRAR